MKRFSLPKTACIIFVVCAATVISSRAQTFTTLHSFDVTDGANPYAALIQGTDRNFYGTTYQGGANGDGTVFKITPAGTLNTLYSFCSHTGCTDGANPYAGLVQAFGAFYGTTFVGGVTSTNCPQGCGTVFRINPAGTLTTLYRFDAADGGYPYAGLIQTTDGNFWGTTTLKGVKNSYGTIFEMNPAGVLGPPKFALIRFDSADGALPYAGLLGTSDGNIYGTTEAGGAHGYGTVYAVGAPVTLLHSFKGTDGANPYAELVQGTDGNFYGTTEAGGANGDGTVFKITPGGALTTLYSFCSQTGCTDGANPYAGLVQGTDGNFYGTTEAGGANGDGTVFSLSVGLSPFPRVTPSTTFLSFGNQVINTTGSQTVTVTNTGSATLDINSITVSANFAISENTCGATLAVGKDCKVSVTFTPTVLSNLTGTLTFTDDAPNSPQTVALAGTGVEPATLVGCCPDFHTVPVFTTKPIPSNFFLTNNLPTALSISGITFTGADPGDFAETDNCDGSVPAKKKCTISVTFTPQATGSRTATLNITDSANNSPQTASLTGTGELQVTWSPTLLTFSSQVVGTTSAAKTVTLTNNLPTALSFSGVTFTGADPSDFAETDTCDGSVAAKNKCTISVTFTPQATGTRTATMNINDSANSSPQTVSLTGTGK